MRSLLREYPIVKRKPISLEAAAWIVFEEVCDDFCIALIPILVQNNPDELIKLNLARPVFVH